MGGGGRGLANGCGGSACGTAGGTACGTASAAGSGSAASGSASFQRRPFNNKKWISHRLLRVSQLRRVLYSSSYSLLIFKNIDGFRKKKRGTVTWCDQVKEERGVAGVGEAELVERLAVVGGQTPVDDPALEADVDAVLVLHELLELRQRLRRRPHPQAEGTALRQPVLDHHLHAVGRHRFISWKLRSSPVRAANTPTQLVGFRPQRASFSQDALKV